MRERKWRAWGPWGEWIEDESESNDPRCEEYERKYVMLHGDALALEIMQECWSLEEILNQPHFDLMDWIDLHDMYGQEIYDKDIVDVTFPNGGKQRAVIEWKDFGWKLKMLFPLNSNPNSQGLSNNPFPHYSRIVLFGYSFKIIGNIYEHPELTESEEA